MTTGILDSAPTGPEPKGKSRGSILGFFSIDNPKDKHMRSTAYLDGLRGFMALLVYVHHHQLWAHGAQKKPQHGIFENGYGWEGEYHLATLYFVRNFFTGGHMAVAIFFVISGYVLAAKPLSLIVDKKYDQLFDSFSSSIVRRWFRLYIPIFITTLVYITTWHVFGYTVSNAKQEKNLRDEIWNWYTECKNLTFLFKEGPIWLSMNVHVWSIPLEMRGSMVVFTSLIGFYRASTNMRLLGMIGLTFYSLYIADAYYCALFCAGVLLCDIDTLYYRKSKDYPWLIAYFRSWKLYMSIFFFIFGMYLAGVPSFTNDVTTLTKTKGWVWLSYLKPQAVFDYKWFYLFWASVMMVSSIPNLPLLKKFFESRFCQYLGRISYALYLVHGPILSSIGDRVYFTFGWVPNEMDPSMEYWMDWFSVSKKGLMGLELDFLLPHLVLVPITFGMANIVTKYVDDYAVSWSARLYTYFVSDEAEVALVSVPADRRQA